MLQPDEYGLAFDHGEDHMLQHIIENVQMDGKGLWGDDIIDLETLLNELTRLRVVAIVYGGVE